MTDAKHLAVIDIGKTNAKVTLAAAADAKELAHRTVPNHVLSDGAYPHFDVALIWDFILDSLAALNRETPVDAIAVVTHGATGAFIDAEPDGDGLALPILDYECAVPEALGEEYDALRPKFSETLSPRLPVGLNLGAQMFWQTRRFAEEVAAAAAYVPYPQYWSWRLTGVAATEMCSLGCHTDLWNPRTATWSSLVRRMGWERMFAPLRPAHDTLSFLKPEIAERLGLGPETRVLCGIHDSSASLLPHLQAREAPFAVLSTGTWTIALAVGGDLDRLDPKRDTLAYVTPFGDPVPAARCMGGREFELLVGGVAREPDKGELTHVLEEQVMALPTFVPGVGPFPHGEGRWTHDPETLSPGERRGAASLYLALMAVELLRCTGAGGPTIIEGPLAANWVFSAALAAITGRPVMPSAGTGGTTRGAVCLLDPKRALAPSEGAPVAPLPCEALPGYARAWRERAAG